MDDFHDVLAILDQRFPGAFACQLGQHGQARGLTIRRPGRSGYAFVYESRDGQPRLLALYNTDQDENPEVWSSTDARELLERLEPWAFVKAWTAPAPVDRVREKKRLEKLAKGLLAREGTVPCSADPSSKFAKMLTAAGKESWDRDVAALDTNRIVRHFPWDAAGRLDLKTAVVLNTYPTTEPPGHERDLCVAAVGPERRSEPQAISVQLLDLIWANQTHRWEDCRWLWTRQEPPATEHLGVESGETSEENSRAIQSLNWLDEGRFEEALSLFGVKLSPDLHAILGGERITPPACCAHPDQGWTDLLVDTLRASAPWLFPKAVADEAARLRQWAAEKPGRRKRAPSLKLAVFPGQFHIRKASLMLVGDLDGQHPRLEIEATGSNGRLHDTAWQRSLAVNFQRYHVSGHTTISGRV